MDWGALLPVFVAVLALIGLGVLAMSVGVIFRRPCLRGSCGGPALRTPDGRKIGCEDCPNRKSGSDPNFKGKIGDRPQFSPIDGN